MSVANGGNAMEYFRGARSPTVLHFDTEGSWYSYVVYPYSWTDEYCYKYVAVLSNT